MSNCLGLEKMGSTNMHGIFWGGSWEHPKVGCGDAYYNLVIIHVQWVDFNGSELYFSKTVTLKKTK